MNIEELKGHWYAYIYDEQENGDQDVRLILETIGPEPQDVLEVACGSGRILARLAEAGHRAAGFDCDDAMLARCAEKLKPFANGRCDRRNAITDDWGGGFDVVVLAGNLLINIVTDIDYSEAQRLFLNKAAGALKPGGHLLLDFDCYERPAETAANRREWVCFEGTDDRGTYGKYIVISGDYDPATHIDRSARRYEITPKGGETWKREYPIVKHFPTLEQVHRWLADAGFVVEREYGDHEKHPIGDKTHRAFIWARKINQ